MFSSGQLILSIFWIIKCADVRTAMGNYDEKNRAEHYKNPTNRIPSESPGAQRCQAWTCAACFLLSFFSFPHFFAAYRFTFQVRQTVGCLYFNLSLFRCFARYVFLYMYVLSYVWVHDFWNDLCVCVSWLTLSL